MTLFRSSISKQVSAPNSGWQRTRRGTPARSPRKPEWVVDELVRLKALMPKAGYRRIADSFNRLHALRQQITVSKSFVAYTLRRECYAVVCKRRELRRRKLYSPDRNSVWALDLTGKQDTHGQRHQILGIIDHGTRRLIDLRAVPNKSAWTLLGYLFLAIGSYGKPNALRTDNERIFTGRVFTQTLKWLRIRHQRSEVGCPWQNGRIERLFGTLKCKLDQWRVLDGEQLQSALKTFTFWYNAVRPHQNLDGRTPLEAWNGIDPYQHVPKRVEWINPYQHVPKRVEWFEAWDGLLNGFYLSG